MRVAATSVADYLAKASSEQRPALIEVYEFVRAKIPEGYEEGLLYGAISWFVPPERYGRSYNGYPIAMASLATQKNHLGLYLNCGHMAGDQGALADAFAAAGKRLDMGKSCVRFRRTEDLALDAIGEYLASFPVDRFLAVYEDGQAGRKQKPIRWQRSPEAASAAPPVRTPSKMRAAAKASPAAKAKASPAAKAKAVAKAKPKAAKPTRERRR
jgi:hypothetical protein